MLQHCMVSSACCVAWSGNWVTHITGRTQGAEEDIWPKEERDNMGMERTTERGALRYVLLTRCYVGDKIKEDEMGEACGMHGRERNLYRVLVGKPEGKRPLGRHSGKREGNIKINLKRTGFKTMNWIYVVPDRGNW